MSDHKNLVFFNKEGDYLNFSYNDSSEIYEGDILFHENSSDTFKTYGVYMMEKIPSFEYQSPGELTTRKFQMFNEWGLHLYGAKWKSLVIKNIEPINNDSNFYSKWIYGDNFESKLPIGTLVTFDQPIMEFNDTDRTYVVVGSKKDAIMVIGQMDNDTFETTYYSEYTDPNTYIGKAISGINAIGVYNYIDDLYADNLSKWSEPEFYDKYYIDRKLNIVNSQNNDGVVTVNDIVLGDQLHFEYYLGKNDLPQNSNLIIEVLTRTDLPKLYEGDLDISGSSTIEITNPALYPQILKPGKEFKIVGSINNTNFLTVSPIPQWNGIVNTTFFATQSQVIYNNLIYQCVQSYTHSFGSQSTAFITPESDDYWSIPTYIKVDQSTIPETILYAQLYLTTDKYYFEYGWTESNDVTLASAAEKYKEDLKLFNIDLFYENNILRSDLIYPSHYAIVNYYHTEVGATYAIGGVTDVMERLVGVREQLDYELNYDISENWRYNIVYTDIDEYGIKLIINGMVYEEEWAPIWSGASLDMDRTIDRTLRNWVSRNYIRLHSLGILSQLKYTGSYNSLFYNSIILETEYPNVPIDINDILVGTTADYYVEHSTVLFGDMGPYLTFTINDDDYAITSSYLPSTNIVDVPTTLSNWVVEYSETLSQYGILVSSTSNLVRFNVKNIDRRLDYTINSGKLNIPGIEDYKITMKIRGNIGMLITSNEILLPDTSLDSFEQLGFATGMVLSINNTYYPYVNSEFNIQFLDPHVMNISYEGPFWGLTNGICNSSSFITLAFDLGFGQTGCSSSVGPTSSIGGPFNTYEFSSAFQITYNPNTYTVNNYDLNTLVGTNGLVDIDYIQLSNSIYAFGDNLVVFDAYTTNWVTTVNLTGNTQSIEMEFNPINNWIYCLSLGQINIVDPVTNTLISTILLSYDAFDMVINLINGDIYVSYTNIDKVDVWSYNNITSTPSSSVDSGDPLFPTCTRTGKMVFNSFEGDIYITTDGDNVIRVNSNRSIQTTYGITGLTHSIFYEPVNESIYVYGSASIWKIDNGISLDIPSVSSNSFNDVIFNNITGEMNISDSSSDFTRLDLNTNTINQTGFGNFGYLALNQFDGAVYMSSLTTNAIFIINPIDGTSLNSEPLSSQSTRIVYNPERKSIWAIQPLINSIVEIEVKLNSTIDFVPISYADNDEENQYGTLDPDYDPSSSIWLKTREYIRRPRENFENDVPVQYYFKWLTDEVPQFFLYDFTGDQLSIGTSYSYNGTKPLENVVLNRTANRDLSKISSSGHQQTIFDKIEWELSYIDDEDDIKTEPTPLELFIGFKSEDEGALMSVLTLNKKELIQFNIDSNAYTNITMETIYLDGVRSGRISINNSSSEIFTNYGLKSGQIIVIYLKDITNSRNQWLSDNTASVFKIREVYTKSIILDFISADDSLIYESTDITDYPSINDNTYLRFTLKVSDKEIGRFNVFGQTEDEDERFKIELGNIGKLIGPDELFIFKEYDIQEGGVDWTILNRKRKEMLMMKHLIYPYIGAYKSIINAINYFGYNDLQLNEYYRNINPKSENFLKLFKIEIPDIFDNAVEGWTENDFIKNTYPNENYEDTNLFNLTYFITTLEGSNVNEYTLDEIIIKLQGLKYWLKRNIIPLTHKILDITGKSYATGGTYITHRVVDARIIRMRQEMTPITSKLTEAYLMPVNSGSTVYNCVIDFYSIIPGVGTELSKYYDKPKPYNGSELVMPDTWTIKIRTYKTYKEWVPFSTYDIGDKVTYYGILYESMISNNRVKNPRKYESSTTWSANVEYEVSSIVGFDRDFYVYSGLGSTQSAQPPNLDPINWLYVTEWKKIDLEPVQTISEFRSGDNLLPYNFTIDSNIDPFIVIEVTSDNGYGSMWRDKKNYEIRGLKDLTEDYRYIDTIGPFTPIRAVY